MVQINSYKKRTAQRRKMARGPVAPPPPRAQAATWTWAGKHPARLGLKEPNDVLVDLGRPSQSDGYEQILGGIKSSGSRHPNPNFISLLPLSPLSSGTAAVLLMATAVGEPQARLSPLSFLYRFPAVLVARGRRMDDGAAMRPLAGARARPRLSTPPSSGRGAVP